VQIESLLDVFGRARDMFDPAEAGDKANLEQAFQAWLDYHGLIWPMCIQSLDSRLAVDLKSD
jgi:hypothetical protein